MCIHIYTYVYVYTSLLLLSLLIVMFIIILLIIMLLLMHLSLSIYIYTHDDSRRRHLLRRPCEWRRAATQQCWPGPWGKHNNNEEVILTHNNT